MNSVWIDDSETSRSITTSDSVSDDKAMDAVGIAMSKAIISPRCLIPVTLPLNPTQLELDLSEALPVPKGQPPSLESTLESWRTNYDEHGGDESEISEVVQLANKKRRNDVDHSKRGGKRVRMEEEEAHEQDQEPARTKDDPNDNCIPEPKDDNKDQPNEAEGTSHSLKHGKVNKRSISKPARYRTSKGGDESAESSNDEDQEEDEEDDIANEDNSEEDVKHAHGDEQFDYVNVSAAKSGVRKFEKMRRSGTASAMTAPLHKRTRQKAAPSVKRQIIPPAALNALQVWSTKLGPLNPSRANPVLLQFATLLNLTVAQVCTWRSNAIHRVRHGHNKIPAHLAAYFAATKLIAQNK